MSRKWAGGSQGSFFRTQNAFNPVSAGDGSTAHSMRFVLFTVIGIALVNKVLRGNVLGTIEESNVAEIESTPMASWVGASVRPRERPTTLEGFVDEKSQ